VLTEKLAGLGYRTGAFISGFSLTRRISGLARGFEVYDDEWSGQQVERFAPETTAAALAWADGIASGERAFLWVHYFDRTTRTRRARPTTGSTARRRRRPGRPARSRRALPADRGGRPRQEVLRRHLEGPMATGTTPAALAAALDGYDGELALMDAWFGRLMAGLAARGLLADALVVVAGDHGEGFDHDYYYAHGDRLYESGARVPMAVWSSAAGARPRLDDLPAGAVDIMPTILEQCGVLGALALDGRRLELAGRRIERGDLELAYSRAPALDRPGCRGGHDGRARAALEAHP